MYMNKIVLSKITLSIIGLILLPFSFSHAQMLNANYGDLGVTIDGDSVDVETEGLDVAVDGDNVDVTAGDLDVDVRDDSVEVKTTNTPATTATPAQQNVTSVRTDSSGNVQVDTDQASIRTNAKTNTSSVSTDVGGLSVMMQDGSVSVETEGMLVDIDDNSRVLFQSESDVRAYADIVEKRDNKIASIESTSDGVEVEYMTEGRLFGIFPKTYISRVTVRDGGEVEVKGPWYSFLMTNKAHAQVKSAVESKLATMTLAVEAEEKPFAHAQVIDVVTDSLQVQVGKQGVSVDTGDVSVDVSDGNVNVDLR